MNRTQLADLIVARLEQDKETAKAQFQSNIIGSFILDDLLPEDICRQIYEAFPAPNTMQVKKSLKEYKYVAAQMNQYNPILEEAVYAFQDVRVVKLVAEITGLKNVFPDEYLYAGGISLMDQGKYLNPHLDNSHDKDRDRYRVLNLLYYVTPDWKQEYGGNLELWDQWDKREHEMQRTIHSKFNRLVVMVTHQYSWHSVSQVQHNGSRCCVSNYYFSSEPVGGEEYFHVTSFRGRPEQKMRDIVLQGDLALRMGIRKIFKKGIVKPKHAYQKDTVN